MVFFIDHYCQLFIAAEAEAFQEELPEKPVTLAIREVADGKLCGSIKEEYKN